jgi:hypothetical protein
VYRLQLSVGPSVTQVFPAAVAESGKTELELVGFNLKTTKHSVEAASVTRDGDIGLIQHPDAMSPMQVLMTNKPALVEKEPNHTKENATVMQAGAVGGRISDKADVDRFAITMKKGEKLQARVFAKRIGLLLDALLKVEGPDDKLIDIADDPPGSEGDPQVVWTAGADGVHQVIVEDLFHQGGADKAYVLEIKPPEAFYEVTLTDAKPIKLAAGKTTSIKVNVKLLNGFKEPLVVRVSGLPNGVHAPEVPVPEKGGEVEVKLIAASDALPSGNVIQVSVWTKTEPPTHQLAKGPLRGESLRGTSLLDSTSQIWLTVTR